MPTRKLYDVPMKQLKVIARGIEIESKQFGLDFVPVDHKLGWVGNDRNGTPQNLKKVFRNRHFAVQIYQQGEWTRLSVNRTALDIEKNTWKGGISWDQLMDIKNKVGFGTCDAIEIYPRDCDVVNLTNMRHLFIVPNGIELSCIWRKTN